MNRSPRTRTRQPEPLGEEAWLDLIRSLPIEARRELLRWLRGFRRRPERVFWEITPTGQRRRL